MDKQLSKRITMLRFVMACIIVIYHVNIGFSTGNILDQQLCRIIDNVNEKFGVLAMDFFFLVTGFFTFYHLDDENYKEKTIKKIHTLFIPYVLWQIIGVIWNFYFKGEFDLLDAFGSVFLMCTFPPVGALWYLYAVFLLSLASKIILKFFKTKKCGFLVVLLALLLRYFNQTFENPIAVSIVQRGFIPNIIYYLPLYMFGAFCGHFSNDNLGIEEIKWCFGIVVFAFLLDPVIDGILLKAFDILFVLLLLIYTPIPSCLQDRKIYHLNFMLYACQKFTISGIIGQSIRRFIERMPVALSIRIVLVKISILIWTILAAAVLYYIMQKCCPKVLSVMVGGRVHSNRKPKPIDKKSGEVPTGI